MKYLMKDTFVKFIMKIILNFEKNAKLIYAKNVQ